MKKKILILHTHNTYNYGSMMMAENLITYLKNNCNNSLEFYLDTQFDRDLIRMREATEYSDIFHDQTMRVSRGKNIYIFKIKELLTSYFRYRKASNFYDMIIFLGGDDLSEVYMHTKLEKIYAIFEIYLLRFLNCRNNTVLLGQTIGPYTGIRKKIASKTFSKFCIYTRDNPSAKMMLDELSIHAKVSKDLAFLDLNLQKKYVNNKKKLLKKYNLEENGYITIVGTEFMRIYSSDYTQFLNSFIEIMNGLQKKYPNKKIVWLSHVTSYPPLGSDNNMLELLLNKFPKEMSKFVIIKDRILPVEARIILGNGYFTVTCRMHAAVSTFQMGKPAIALSYSPKYRGVIADGLKREDLVIEAKGEEIWKKKIVSMVLDKSSYIEKNYDSLITQIKEQVSLCQEEVLSTILEISNILNGDDVK